MANDAASCDDVKHVTAERKFVLTIGDASAYLEYEEFDNKPNVYAFTHTYTPVSLRGKGLASIVTRAAFNHFKAIENARIVPSCTYISGNFLVKHPEFNTIVYDASADAKEAKETSPPVIVHDEQRHAFVSTATDGSEAIVEYTLADNVLSINSTRVPPAFRGQGLAAKLVDQAFKYVMI
jgi:uncharacterized protein